MFLGALCIIFFDNQEIAPLVTKLNGFLPAVLRLFVFRVSRCTCSAVANAPDAFIEGI